LIKIRDLIVQSSIVLVTFSSILLVVAFSAPHVAAHHGWSTFETRYAYYASGTLTEVRWGNPHTEVILRVEETVLPSGWSDRELPPGASDRNGELTMASARPYLGEYEELHLVLAGPEWMEQWGLDRELEVGESIEVVGFLNTDETDELRPVMFWLADGQGVWQQLTSFPQEPEPAQGNAQERKNETEEPNNTSGQNTTTHRTNEKVVASNEIIESTSEEKTSSITIWLLVGSGVVITIVIGGFFLKRKEKGV